MGYDYSLGFLGRHQELVRKLIEVARTGVVLTYTSETWEPIRQRHQLVRSVLANMSVNMKDYADIRKTIRTWTEHTDDGFRLMVGAPSHKVTGRPPGAPSDGWKQNYVPVSDAGETYSFPGTIDDVETYTKFVGQLMTLPPNVRRVEAKFPMEDPNEDTIEAFNEQLSKTPFKAVATEGSILILIRR